MGSLVPARDDPTAALQLPRNCVLWSVCISHLIFESVSNREGFFVFVSYGMCLFRSCNPCSCSDNDRELLCERCWPAVNHGDDGKPPTGLKLQRTVREEFALNPLWDLFCLTSALFPWRAGGTRSLLTAPLSFLVLHGLQRWKDGCLMVGDSKQAALFTCGTKNTW